MTMPRTSLDFLEDIRSAAQKARAFTAGMTYGAFAADEKTAYAVVRALEIIGEAAKRVPDEIRDKSPDTPWRSMAGIRDKLVHDYVSVNLEIVWKTVTDDLPTLLSQIEELIDGINAEKSPRRQARPKAPGRGKRKNE
jgi:uncharacterized protein with HEPN domain